MVVVTREITPKDGSMVRPKGASGVIVRAPDAIGGDYRIRFADGVEITLPSAELEVLKHYQNRALGDAKEMWEAYDFRPHVEYVCVVGSRAYGLDHEGSDLDLRGFYLAPPELHWSLWGVPEQLEYPEGDECYWELEKFLKLALKANPNVLECLYTPLVRKNTALADELLGMREVFLSRMIYQTYSRYVMSQFKSMTRRLGQGKDVKPKHAMHLLRLMLSGITILEQGFVPLNVDEHKEELLAIKHEERTWEDVERWRLELHERFDRAMAATELPERPDYAQVNAFLVHARRQAAA